MKTDCHTPHIAPTVSLSGEHLHARCRLPTAPPSSSAPGRRETGHQLGRGSPKLGDRGAPNLSDQDAEGRVAWKWLRSSPSVPKQHPSPHPPHSPINENDTDSASVLWLFTQKSWKLLSTQNPHMDVCSRLISCLIRLGSNQEALFRR